MKKLMIAVFAVVAAAVAQAATINWSAGKGYLYDGTGSNTKITAGDAYLMVVTATFTQDNLVSAFTGFEGDIGKTVEAMSSSGALASGTGTIGANARIPSTNSTYSLSTDSDIYFVVFANEKMYISETASAIYDPVMQEAAGTFASLSASSKETFDAADGFSAHGAGWYNVPEPTSGLMMLLGMGVLALRRRRA